MTIAALVLAWPMFVAPVKPPVFHVFANSTSSAPLMTLSAARSLTIMGATGGELVVVDLATGKVTLHGDPNAAALSFWAAVERLGAARAAQPCQSR